MRKEDCGRRQSGHQDLSHREGQTAREILAQDMEQIRHVVGAAVTELAAIHFWSHRLMEDQLRLATTNTQRLAAIREHRDRMVDLEGLISKYARTGQGLASDALKAKYYRLEADQLLSVPVATSANPPPAPSKLEAVPPSPPPRGDRMLRS